MRGDARTVLVALAGVGRQHQSGRLRGHRSCTQTPASAGGPVSPWTRHRCGRRRVNHVTVYCFELSFTAPPGERTIDALYEAGWDDATVSFDPMVGGPGLAAFDREANSAVEAIASAIRQVRSAGAEITAVSEDLVTLAEIAERAGRTLATADHWPAGRRGPGRFPEPRIRRPRASLYSWAQVGHGCTSTVWQTCRWWTWRLPGCARSPTP